MPKRVSDRQGSEPMNKKMKVSDTAEHEATSNMDTAGKLSDNNVIEKTTADSQNAAAQNPSNGSTLGTPSKHEIPSDVITPPTSPSIHDSATDAEKDYEVLNAKISTLTGRQPDRADIMAQWGLCRMWKDGGVTLDCTMGMHGPLRSLHGLKSIDEATEVVKTWPRGDKNQIRNCPVYVLSRDPTTKRYSERIIGKVVPSRGGTRPSGAKLQVVATEEERVRLEQAWEVALRDRL